MAKLTKAGKLTIGTKVRIRGGAEGIISAIREVEGRYWWVPPVQAFQVGMATYDAEDLWPLPESGDHWAPPPSDW